MLVALAVSLVAGAAQTGAAAQPTEMRFACAGPNGALFYTASEGACRRSRRTSVSFHPGPVNLETNAVFDFETKSSYSVRIGVTDSGSATYEEQFTITVTDVAENAPPTDIQLSNSTVAENQPVGTTVGTLTTTDPDARGLGTGLMQDVLAEADAAGKRVTIYVERFNPALRLYERLGFAHAADEGVYLFLERRPDQVKTAS